MQRVAGRNVRVIPGPHGAVTPAVSPPQQPPPARPFWEPAPKDEAAANASGGGGGPSAEEQPGRGPVRLLRISVPPLEGRCKCGGHLAPAPVVPSNLVFWLLAKSRWLLWRYRSCCTALWASWCFLHAQCPDADADATVPFSIVQIALQADRTPLQQSHRN